MYRSLLTKNEFGRPHNMRQQNLLKYIMLRFVSLSLLANRFRLKTSRISGVFRFLPPAD